MFVSQSRIQSRKFFARCMSDKALRPEYEYILAEKTGKTGLITLNRPKALNALCNGLLDDLIHAARAFDDDAEVLVLCSLCCCVHPITTLFQVGAIVITGSPKAFAAGADIKEMAKKTYAQTYKTNMFRNWADITKITKPVSCSVWFYTKTLAILKFVLSSVVIPYTFFFK